MAGAAKVDYELVVYEELPSASTRGGGRSILNEQLERIMAAPEAWGKPVRIGLYTVGSAASAAKRVLINRFGRTPQVSGWAFHTRPVPVSMAPDATVRRGLFAVYTPEVSGQLEESTNSG
jgi:hypothetical protein